MANFQLNDGSNIERTLVMLKPDAFERGLVGEIMDMIDRRGLRMVASKLFVMTPEQCKLHYAHHTHKEFYPQLVEFMTSGPSLAIVYEGEYACNAVRQLIGQKHPHQSPAGSIRGKFAMEFPRNLIHGSDHTEDANKEISLYFTFDEIFDASYASKIEAIAEKKKEEAKLLKQQILNDGVKVGDVIPYVELVQKSDIIQIAPYFYSVSNIEKINDSYKLSLSCLSHTPFPKLAPVYTPDAWETEGDIVLIKRGNDVAPGYAVPGYHKVNGQLKPKFTKNTEPLRIHNPAGLDITSGQVPYPNEIANNEHLAVQYLNQAASYYKNEVKDTKKPFTLRRGNKIVWTADGVHKPKRVIATKKTKKKVLA